MSPHELEFLSARWDVFAHAYQLPPPTSANGEVWSTWMIVGGRGAGKTRAGSEWIRAQALGLQPFADCPVGRIALVGQTEHDVREIIVEGVSGILSVHRRDERPEWIASRRRLQWSNGAVAYAFSAEDPESLRGPQFGCAWSDEIAKWRYPQETFDMLQFGLRLGARPKQLITTTPRPIDLMRKLLADPAVAVTRASTQDNAYHLSPAFLRSVAARYAGTRLGRQELDGELIEDRADALWSRALIERCRVKVAPDLQRIVVAIDPPASSGKGADSCGIVAAGICGAGDVYVIADDTIAGASPSQWASRAIALWRRLDADSLVAEVNQGGEMVNAIIKQIDNTVPVNPVRATRGKWVRAEPVAALYEQGRVKHAGSFPALEDEMCDFARSGLSHGRSPDRVDALVWAVTSLVPSRYGEPRVREL